MAKRLTLYIGIALVLGIIVGSIVNATASPETIESLVKYLGLVTFAFLRLIKMIIAPFYHITSPLSLSIVGGVLIISVAASILFPIKEEAKG